jgi:hypothetical protein
MQTMTIWSVGTVLEILLLVRAYQGKLVSHFPVFYTYLLFITVDDLLRIAVYRWFPSDYFQVYWITQFLSLVIGSGIIFEIYRVALSSFPGAARMSRYLLFVVFGAVFARAIVVRSAGLISWLASSSLMLERNLRIVQALAILTLVTLFLWYAIPFGRNLKGILIGYSLFIAVSITQFVLWIRHWNAITSYWPHVESVSYLLVLGIWATMLWSFRPAPQEKQGACLETDYELVLSSTRNQFRRTLARLGWAARA